MHSDFLWEAASYPKKALPILSFPVARKLGITVRELIHSSELQAKVMEYAAHNTNTAAAVSLMDLSVEAEAFGAEVSFSDWEVPTVRGCVVSDEAEAEALAIPSVGSGRTGICVEAIALAKEAIPDKPLLAGIIGPYSLAGRLMDVTEIMYACYDDPQIVHTVLAKCTQFLIDYALAFKAAGADGVIMAEPLAGLLNADMADEFSCRYGKRILEAVQREDFPVVYHNCGNAALSILPELLDMGCAAYHFGNAVSMEEVLKKAPADVLCMGNISPAERFAGTSVSAMRLAARALMDTCGAYPNFIPSSGCDIPAYAAWENIMAFYEEVENTKNIGMNGS